MADKKSEKKVEKKVGTKHFKTRNVAFMVIVAVLVIVVLSMDNKTLEPSNDNLSDEVVIDESLDNSDLIEDEAPSDSEIETIDETDEVIIPEETEEEIPVIEEETAEVVIEDELPENAYCRKVGNHLEAGTLPKGLMLSMYKPYSGKTLVNTRQPVEVLGLYDLDLIDISGSEAIEIAVDEDSKTYKLGEIKKHGVLNIFVEDFYIGDYKTADIYYAGSSGDDFELALMNYCDGTSAIISSCLEKRIVQSITPCPNGCEEGVCIE